MNPERRQWGSTGDEPQQFRGVRAQVIAVRPLAEVANAHDVPARGVHITAFLQRHTVVEQLLLRAVDPHRALSAVVVVLPAGDDVPVKVARVGPRRAARGRRPQVHDSGIARPCKAVRRARGRPAQSDHRAAVARDAPRTAGAVEVRHPAEIPAVRPGAGADVVQRRLVQPVRGIGVVSGEAGAVVRHRRAPSVAQRGAVARNRGPAGGAVPVPVVSGRKVVSGDNRPFPADAGGDDEPAGQIGERDGAAERGRTRARGGDEHRRNRGETLFFMAFAP